MERGAACGLTLRATYTQLAFGTAGAQAVIVTLRTAPINSIAAITFPQRQVVNQ
jgi:hypothetical protein